MLVYYLAKFYIIKILVWLKLTKKKCPSFPPAAFPILSPNHCFIACPPFICHLEASPYDSRPTEFPALFSLRNEYTLTLSNIVPT